MHELTNKTSKLVNYFLLTRFIIPIYYSFKWKKILTSNSDIHNVIIVTGHTLVETEHGKFYVAEIYTFM